MKFARSIAVALAALSLALTGLATSTAGAGVAGESGAVTAGAAGAAATGESGSPIDDQGSDYHYRSYIDRVDPATPGLKLQVLDFADRLQLSNRTGMTVTIYGYGGEPYARLLADGTVQVNTRSPAYYLNQSFYGNITVPASASASAPPRWRLVDRVGQFEWHDHRIHWMSPALPPQVKDRDRRTKIFDWRVPLQVGSRRGAVDGRLYWTPPAASRTPTAAIVALAAIVVLGLGLVLVVRRRRARSSQSGPRAAW